MEWSWFAISGATMNTAGYLLLGIAVIMLSGQVMFIPEYRILAFTPDFWTFTFPLTASASFVFSSRSARTAAWSRIFPVRAVHLVVPHSGVAETPHAIA